MIGYMQQTAQTYPGVKVVPAEQLELQPLEALPHHDVEELDEVEVHRPALPDQPDGDLVDLPLLVLRDQREHLPVARPGVEGRGEEHRPVEDVVLQDLGVLPDHDLDHEGAVLLGGDIDAVLVEPPLALELHGEVVGEEAGGRRGGGGGALLLLDGGRLRAEDLLGLLALALLLHPAAGTVFARRRS